MFQYLSLAAVMVALFFAFRQNQQISRQTQEASRQTSTILASLQQNAYHAMVTHPTVLRASFLREDPVLLAWHLEARGFGPADPAQNRRRLYVLIKFDMHELNFVSHEGGLLADELWSGWQAVVETDFASPEFRECWHLTKRFYALSFVTYVDSVIAVQVKREAVAEA